MKYYDIAWKKVMLFATSGGSDIGNYEKSLWKQYPQVDWKSGKPVNSHNAVKGLAKSL